MNSARAAAGLPVGDIPRIVEAWLRLLWTGARLRMSRPPHQALTSGAIDSRAAVTMDGPLARFDRIVRRAARLLPVPPTCLTRALVLHGFLVRHGIAARMRIGVRRESATIAAHAWVECAGRPIGEQGDPRAAFRPLGGGSGA